MALEQHYNNIKKNFGLVKFNSQESSITAKQLFCSLMMI
jgi:hypothetical protein